MEKYIVCIEKAAESTYFLKLMFEINGEEVKEIKDIIYPNCNKIKVIAKRGDYDISNIYEQNIKILDENEIAILKLHDLAEIKQDAFYSAENENSTKFFTYLNKISLENVEDKIYEILDLNNFIVDFFKFKHEEITLLLDMPITSKIFFEYKNKIYGPLKWEVKGEKYLLRTLDQNYSVKKYNFDEVKDIIHSIQIKNYSTRVIIANEINLKLKNNILEDKEDFIKTDLFVNQFINQMKSEDKKLSKNEIAVLKEKLKSPTLSLNEERKRIIEEKLSDNEIYFQIKENIINDILKDEDKLKSICKKIVTENFSEIKQNSDILKVLQELMLEKEDKEKELENINHKIEFEKIELEKIRKNKEKELEIHNDKKLQDLKKQLLEKSEELKVINEELKKKNNEYIHKLEKFNLIDQLEKINESVKLENYHFERTQKEYNQKIDGLRTKIDELKGEAEKYSQKSSSGYTALLEEAIEKIKEEYKDNAFEFFTINKLQEIESRKNKEKLTEKLKDDLLQNQKVNSTDLSINDFLEEQLEFFNKNANRKIQKNDLINIILCVSQGFLTILAGEPGTGKTSLCRILGKSLGLFSKENSRYLEVSVEKGWTSKRDFIGYYNPLNKQIDYANERIFEALNILNFEKINEINDYPFLFILDEANLSPMEYYWADFMNICEMDDLGQREITIGDEYSYSLPKSLRFLATINYDHTTEILSPRLLDRAWIILLENEEIDINNLRNIDIENSSNMISYEMFEKFRNIENGEMSPTLSNRLKEIVNCLRENDITVSLRVQKMIKNYCVKGSEIFEKGKNDLIALDYAVSQKLLPLLEGYGDDYREFLKQFYEIQLSGMEKCQKIVKSMISKGDKNMKHYYFFHN